MHSTIPNSIKNTDTLDETAKEIGRQRKTQKVIDTKRQTQTYKLAERQKDRES